ncbi:hypothetical protein NL400_26840, partial [Klebsiella pneumoniae]|nr:hypothetical protein [Klebsiella pneumoniae]
TMNLLLPWLFLIMNPLPSLASGLDDDRGVNLLMVPAREYAEEKLGACAAHRHLADAALPLRPSPKTCPRAFVLFEQTQTLQREAAT